MGVGTISNCTKNRMQGEPENPYNNAAPEVYP